MKLLATIICMVFMSGMALAGGSTGGNPGLALNDMIAFTVQSLPKAYLDADDFRRTQARLSLDRVESVPVIIDGQEQEAKRILGMMVIADFSKEILPTSPD